MGVIFDERKYPVIDKAPSFRMTVGNFSLRDCGIVALSIGASAPYGYVVGLKKKIARPSMYAAMFLGGVGGFMLAYQNSFGRLMGLRPNDREVEKFLADK